MKLIGHTNDGGVLYELSQEEDHNFRALVGAVAGDDIDSFRMGLRRDPERFDDFSGVFGAIRAFALAKFKITEMRQVIDQFERSLEQQE